MTKLHMTTIHTSLAPALRSSGATRQTEGPSDSELRSIATASNASRGAQKIIFTLLFSFMLNLPALLAQPLAPSLNCVNRAIGGSNDIAWTASQACPNFDHYQIFASNTGVLGPYTLVTTITNPATTTFSHLNVNSGSVLWHYYVLQSCGGLTSAPSDTLDNEVPEPPEVLAVSIENGDPFIWWRPGTSPETFAYNVYVSRTVGDVPIVGGQFIRDTFYSDVSSLSNIQPERYVVRTVDSCNVGISLLSDYHRTMYLSATAEPCTREVFLTWSLYEGWANGIERQEIWLGVNGAPMQVIDTVSASTTNYTLPDARDGDVLCFVIRAYPQGIPNLHSKSNLLCFLPALNEPVDELFVTNVSTSPPSAQLEVSWYLDTDADLSSAFVYRQMNTSGTISQEISLPNNLSMSQYTDPDVLGSTTRFRYRLQTVDGCGDTLISAFVSAIFLQGEAQDNLQNFLDWTPYDNPRGQVITYEIYRIDNGVETLISSQSGNQISAFTHEPAATDPSTRNICYFVRAKALLNMPDGSLMPVEANSNTICLEQAPKVLIPNAFAPDGLNNIFRPILVFAELNSFEMRVYNRWGAEVFRGTDPILGWDGDAQPHGVYTYIMELVTSDGETITRSGNVTLIR
jgi:hypothetical protein